MRISDWSSDVCSSDLARAKALIEKIITHAITKYNFSSVGYYEHPDLPPESVLVIDQKGGDASIEFAGATNRTFELMLDAAIRENPGKSIFFKQHQIGRAHVCTPVTNAPLVCRLLLEKNKYNNHINSNKNRT